MAEYIEREALLAFPIRTNHYDKENGNLDFILGIESVMEYAEYIPAADVMPVKHGRWICEETLGIISLNGYECSICHNYNGRATKYCPNCGAKMEVDNAELKPCLCGGEAVVRRVGDMKQFFMVFCSVCGKTPVKNCEARLTIFEAKRVWNRKVNDGQYS